MKPERIRVGKGVQERRETAGKRTEGREVGELQGERKDTRDGKRKRTREPRTAGGKGLNGAETGFSSSALHTPIAGGQARKPHSR